jgi:hypothetical protein
MGERYRFRSETQRAAVCRRILAIVGLADLWTDKGPKSIAWRPLMTERAYPAYEMLFLLAAWCVWVDDDLSRLVPAFEEVDARLAQGVAALHDVLQTSPGAIDAWVAVGRLTSRR